MIVMTCPMCSKHCGIELDNDQERRLFEWRSGDGYIQEKLGDLNSTEREFLKTGYCLDCQALLFDNGVSNKIKEIEHVR